MKYKLNRNTLFICYNFLFFCSVAFFCVGLLLKDLNLITISTFLQFLTNICFSLQDFNKRIVFFSFNITYFTFLSSRPIVKILFNYYDFYNQNGILGFSFTDFDVVFKILVALYFGLFFLLLCYKYSERKNIKYSFEKNTSFGISNASIALMSKLFYYFSLFFLILIILEKSKFTSLNSYTELYSGYQSNYPALFTKISEMNSISLFVFLGTLPSKKKTILPLTTYLLTGILYLIVGQRNNFVLNILIILIYLCIRNLTDKTENNWFGRREIVTCLVSFPFLISLLNFVSYSRMKDSIVKNHGFLDKIAEFFYAQSVSSNLIGYSQTLNFPEGKIYSLGRLIDFIKSNFFTKIIFQTETYPPQTVESALYSNSFADAVSYILSPKRYLSGWGYGSSYLAEFMKDGGLILVILGSLLMGYILANSFRIFFVNAVFAGLSLSMIRLLLYAPRDTFLSFFVTTFSIVNVLTIFLILVSALLIDTIRRNS